MAVDESRYSRQVVLSQIGDTGQRLIEKGTAVIIGLGALGSTVANILARAGVGTLRLVDRDFVDWTNLQRQGLYDESDATASIPKAEAAREHLVRVNSEIEYDAIVDDVNPGNVESIVAGATVVVDGLDNFYTRALLNEACVKLQIPWVHGACVSTRGVTAVIRPGETACYACLFPDASTMTSPYTCDTVGVFGPVAFAVASLEAAEALKILSRHGNTTRSDGLTMLDLWSNETSFVSTKRNPECSVCERHEFRVLRGPNPFAASSLCGRNAVQVMPTRKGSFDFESVLATLRRAFPTESSQYLLKSRLNEFELVVFRDGRAVVFGTSDPTVAKSLYTRYVGG